MIKVEYNDHMGDCLKPVQMARGSYNRTTEWEAMKCQCGFIGDSCYCPSCDTHSCTGTMKEKDRRLLTMLARGMGDKEYRNIIEDIGSTNSYEEIERLIWKFRHTPAHLAPFGHNFLTVYFEAPVFVMRQIVKHKFLRLSEMSMRYVRGMPEYYKPKSWRAMADDVKQGSVGDHSVQDAWYDDLDYAYETDKTNYDWALDHGLCAEQARTFLRLCHMTQGYMSGSMDAWANLVIQRIDPHAQYETQLFARKVDDVCNETWPISWPALTEGVQR